jgi:hypothetical protein
MRGSSAMAPAANLLGGCHCGRLRVALASGLDPAGINPRACDCSFCQKHGAAYISDPAGQLVITLADPLALHRYRQGSNTAEFLICNRCGVLVAVLADHGARLYAAVNARCLDAFGGFGPAVPASPQQLAAGEKMARWLRLWVPDVALVMDHSDTSADGSLLRDSNRT